MEEVCSWFEKVICEYWLEGEQMFQYVQVLKVLGSYEKVEQWFFVYVCVNKDDQEWGNYFVQSCCFVCNQIGQFFFYLVSNEFINFNVLDFVLIFYGDQVVFFFVCNNWQQLGVFWIGCFNNQFYMACLGGNGFLEVEVFLQSCMWENFVNFGLFIYGFELREVVYIKNNFIDGICYMLIGGLELSMAMLFINQNGEWIEEIFFFYNGLGFFIGWLNIFLDGNIFYFVFDCFDGFGGFDIYVFYWMGNIWSVFENFGLVVNLFGDEIFFFYDGDYLYFFSNYYQGMGGYDIFCVE